MSSWRPASAARGTRVFVYRGPVSAWCVVILACVLAACSRSTAASSDAAAAEPAPDLSKGYGAAEDVVKAFFVAAESEDCAALAKILILPDAGTLTPEGCEAITHDFTESKAHLLRITESKVDGRDKRVVLVSTEVEYTKKKSGSLHQWVIRAEWRNGIWKVRF